MTKPDDEIDREAIVIKSVIDACRGLMADLEPSAKQLVVQQLHRWVTLEEATHDPAHRPERRH